MPPLWAHVADETDDALSLRGAVQLVQKLRKDLELLLAMPTPQEPVQQRDVLDPLAGLEEEEVLECVASNCDKNVN